MVYLKDNSFKSGAAIKRALQAGVELEVFQPDPANFSGVARPISIPGGYQGYASPVPDSDFEVVEGPHYPQPHRFYVGVEIKDGKVVKIIKR